MTPALNDQLACSEHAEAFGKLQAVLEANGRADADLEYVLSFVRTLRDVAGDQGAHGLARDQLQRLDDAISDQVAEFSRPPLPRRHTPYHHVMRWVGGTVRDHPVEVFTTNYDLLAEQAAGVSEARGGRSMSPRRSQERPVSNSKAAERLRLGDFAEFARLLDELTGGAP